MFKKLHSFLVMGGDGNILNQMQVQQDILSGLMFDDEITGTKDLKLPIYKHGELIKTIKDICAVIPTEEQKVRLLSLYILNYKIMKDVDFD